MPDKLSGIFGTLQLNGTIVDPICYVHLPSVPPPGTLLALPGPNPAYYRVIQTMLIVKPINELTIAAMMERVEAGGEKYDTLSDRCIVFVEPYDP
jgi:hypothetical protein